MRANLEARAGALVAAPHNASSSGVLAGGGATASAAAASAAAAVSSVTPLSSSSSASTPSTPFGFGHGGPPGPGTAHKGKGMEVVVTLLGAGKPPFVVAAAPSEGCGAFTKRLLLLLDLPVATDCKLIYAAHGKALSGVRTLAQVGVGHRAGLQLEILDGQIASTPTSMSGADGGGSGGEAIATGSSKPAGYGEVGGIQAFGSSASASSSKAKPNKSGGGSSSGSKAKSRRSAQGPSKDI